MVSHWSFSDCKSPQVSRTLPSILADLNNAVVWMVSTDPFIFKSSSLCTNPSVTVPRALITIGITVTFMSLNFFNFLARSVDSRGIKVYCSASYHFCWLLLDLVVDTKIPQMSGILQNILDNLIVMCLGWSSSFLWEPVYPFISVILGITINFVFYNFFCSLFLTISCGDVMSVFFDLL